MNCLGNDTCSGTMISKRAPARIVKDATGKRTVASNISGSCSNADGCTTRAVNSKSKNYKVETTIMGVIWGIMENKMEATPKP